VEFLLNPNQQAATIDGALVCIVNGELQYLKSDDLLDPRTKKTSVRVVDLAKPSYKVAREYMIRLEKEDFDNSDRLEKLARSASSPNKPISADEFKKQFAPIVTELRGGL
jgi:6-phosphofructokinase 1